MVEAEKMVMGMELGGIWSKTDLGLTPLLPCPNFVERLSNSPA